MNALKRFINKKRSATFRIKLVLGLIGGPALFVAAFLVPQNHDDINVYERGLGGGPDSYFHHIYDPNGLLGPLGSVDLNLYSFQLTSGNSILFAAFPSLPSDDPYFTMQIAERWAPSKSRDDRGLVIFLFMKERRIRVEVGYGLEDVLTDVATAHMVTNTMVPLLREGKTTEAVEACAKALLEGLPQEKKGGDGLRDALKELKTEMPSFVYELKRRAALAIKIWKNLPLMPRLIMTGIISLLWIGFVTLLMDLGYACIKLIRFIRRAWISHDVEGGKEAIAGIAGPLVTAAAAAAWIFIIGTFGEYFRSGTGLFGGGGVNIFW